MVRNRFPGEADGCVRDMVGQGRKRWAKPLRVGLRLGIPRTGYPTYVTHVIVPRGADFDFENSSSDPSSVPRNCSATWRAILVPLRAIMHLPADDDLPSSSPCASSVFGPSCVAACATGPEARLNR